MVCDFTVLFVTVCLDLIVGWQKLSIEALVEQDMEVLFLLTNSILIEYFEGLIPSIPSLSRRFEHILGSYPVGSWILPVAPN